MIISHRVYALARTGYPDSVPKFITRPQIQSIDTRFGTDYDNCLNEQAIRLLLFYCTWYRKHIMDILCEKIRSCEKKKYMWLNCHFSLLI